MLCLPQLFHESLLPASTPDRIGKCFLSRGRDWNWTHHAICCREKSLPHTKERSQHAANINSCFANTPSGIRSGCREPHATTSDVPDVTACPGRYSCSHVGPRVRARVVLGSCLLSECGGARPLHERSSPLSTTLGAHGVLPKGVCAIGWRAVVHLALGCRAATQEVKNGMNITSS